MTWLKFTALMLFATVILAGAFTLIGKITWRMLQVMGTQ